MTSTRLPGKVLRPVLGRPLLDLQIERVSRARRLARLVVATSTDPSDDPIEAYCRQAGVACRRGSLHDVLDRFLAVLDACGPVEHFVRLTGDCPLADPTLIDEAIESHHATGADYTYVQKTWSFPKGLDVEVCRAAVLRDVGGMAVGAEREHVTAFIRAHPGDYRINTINRDPPLRFRWTVDTEADLAFVRSVYEDLYPVNPAFTTSDVLAWQTRHPDRVMVNDEAPP
jgi:spore coat polysaccharide biosynthesis protein SpsF